MFEQSIAGFQLGEYELEGYIDLLDIDGRIWDFKVGKQHKTQDGADKDIQLTLYAWALGTNNVGFVSISSATGDHRLVPSSRSDEQIEVCYDALTMIADNIAAANDSEDIRLFPPYIESTFGCKGCALVGSCPFGRVI